MHNISLRPDLAALDQRRYRLKRKRRKGRKAAKHTRHHKSAKLREPFVRSKHT